MTTVIQTYGGDQEELYRTILQRILTLGTEESPRGLKTRALRNVVIEHEDPTDVMLLGTGRRLSPGLLALEPLQLVGGFSDPELTVRVVPYYARFMDDGRFWGAYGERTSTQIELVADRLRRDPSTRQARVTFWDDRLDLAHEGKRDYPCTTGAEFYVVDGKLHGTTFMRSNDAWLGYPYDVVQHTCLLKSLASYLHLPVGTYTHIVTNLHLYEKDWIGAEELLSGQLALPDRPRMVGGIGTGDHDTWAQVQNRARMLLHSPHDIQPATEEEAWYRKTMIRESEKINAKS